MSLEAHRKAGAAPLRVAVVTASDTRDSASDTGGAYLVEACSAAGHSIAARLLVRDEPAELVASFEALVARDDVDLLLYTGGTGLAPRDTTPDALQPRFDRDIPGFGELFRFLSWQEIGAAAILSRACAGTARGKVVVLLPGSPKALKLAWERILAPECGHLVAQARVKPI